MTPCRCGCGADNSQACRNPRFQPAVPHAETLSQRFLRERNRRNPVDRGQRALLTRLEWVRVRAAYGHLCDRAEAWGVEPAEQLAVEDTAGLYETAPETVSPCSLPAEQSSPGVMGPPKPADAAQAIASIAGVIQARRLADEVLADHAKVTQGYARLWADVQAVEPRPGWLSRAWKWVTR